MIKIDTQLLDSVSVQARSNERLRMNYNFHDTPESKAQRLLNALEPGTSIPIHRHPETAETYIILHGKIKVFFYDDTTRIIQSCLLDRDSGNYGVHIPAGQWHNLEVLKSGTVIFEVKDGPYAPLNSENILQPND